MNKYSRTLGPGPDRVGRWVTLVIYVVMAILNIVVGVTSLLNGRLLGLLNVAVLIVLALCAVWVFRIWVDTDKTRAETQQILDRMEARRREDYHPETSVFTMPDEIKLVDDPKDANDVFQHMMSRAFNSESGAGMYRDPDGVWRDSETREALPVQEDGSGPQKGAQR